MKAGDLVIIKHDPTETPGIVMSDIKHQRKFGPSGHPYDIEIVPMVYIHHRGITRRVRIHYLKVISSAKSSYKPGIPLETNKLFDTSDGTGYIIYANKD